MADDIIVLLSSDDSCEDAFVTPHHWDARGVFLEAATTPTRLDDRTGKTRPLPSTSPLTASPVVRQSRPHADIIEIDDTPDLVARADRLPCRPSNEARSGFEENISDSLPSSTPSLKKPCSSKYMQTPTLSRPPTTLPKISPRKSAGELAGLAAIQRLQSSRAGTDGRTDYNDYDAVNKSEVIKSNVNSSDIDHDGLCQNRPVKRLRLLPAAASEPDLVPTIQPSACMSSRVMTDLHLTNENVLLSSSTSLLPQAQPHLRYRSKSDMEDDMHAFFQIDRESKRDRNTELQHAIGLPKGTDFVDLLSSSESDSELKQTRAMTKPQLADPSFVDIDDLLMQSSPQTSKQQQFSRQKQLNNDIMLLSSSPIVVPVEPGQSSNLSHASSKSAMAAKQPTRSTKKSSSEGHKMAFSDDEESEDAIAAEALLADWRKTHPEVSKELRASSYQSMASPPRKRKRIVDEKKRLRMAAEKAQRQKDKEVERERRAREKEVDKERRKIASDQAKDKKAKERAETVAFNNANKSRVDKAVAAPEMIVRLPASMSEATRDVIESMLTDADISHETWSSIPLPNVVTWQRKVSNEYLPDLGHWVPVPTRIVDEAYALVILRSEDFVNLVVAGQDDDPDAHHAAGGHNLTSHVAAMKNTFAGNTIVYLLEGLQAWRNKKRITRNRQFVAAVQRNGNEATSSTERQEGPIRPSQRLGRRGQKQAPPDIDEALVDESLLDLQMDHNYDGGDNGGTILVHETSSALDTARWIHVFTEQIATGRYRQQKETLYAAAASFCMDSGQITTGDDPQNLYALILQQVARVTEPVALGIAARFDDIPRLVRGFEEEGPLALEAIPKSRTRNGALSDRMIGPALSRRLYKVFIGRDAANTDV